MREINATINDKNKNIKFGKNVTLKTGAILYNNLILGDNVKIMPGAVIGYPPQGTGATKRKINTAPKITTIGAGSIIMCNAVIYAGATIGKNTMVCDLASIREGCVIGDKCIIARGVTINYNTKIGNRVKIMDNTHITGGMIIEDGVFISCLVATTNDNSMGIGIGHTCDGPIIRKGARIGAHVTILPGIHIGAYAIVASGSVVTHDVEPYSLVMGIPARVKK